MAGHDRDDWFEREEFIGQISDIRVQNLQVEREVVQKRTFTRWMNLHLEKCDPPIQVHDLFQDIQDGHILMALLEELSGCRLLHGFKKSSHRIFRLNNIAKVLTFLEERNVKLVSIDAADVADGNPSIILGLIWNIILFFQIKELTGNIRSQFPSSSSLSSIPNSSDSDTSHSSTPSEERPSTAAAMRENSKAIKKLLQWIQKRTRKYSVAVQDFGKSWTSGLAFLAVIKSIDSSLVDMRKALLRSPRENLEEAFRIAHYSLGIPRLLEPEDVAINTPDEQSIIMYVSQFLEHFPGIEEPEESCQLIERSVSMGRLNFRDRDSDQVRNGARSDRLRGRSYMFQKEQPPPKILISSVSEDRSVLSPRLRVAAARSWSSEDFLTDSPHMDDVSSSVHVNATEQDSACDSPQQSHAHSPSFVPESGITESVIGDSAINSPDSWMESELMPERFCESHSDGSLCDSEAAWDVYRATPVEVTTLDEGFNSSLEDRGPDEQSMTGSYIEEEMCSLESAREGIHGQSERNHEELKERQNQDLDNQELGTEPEPDLRERNNPTEMDSEQKDASPPQKDKKPTEPEPSSTLCETEVLICSGAEDLESDQPNQVQSGPSTALQPPDEEDGAAESPHREEEWAEEEQDGQRKNSESQETGSGPDEGEDPLKERDDRGRETPNEDHSRDEESSSSSSAASQPGLTIPLISISSEPEEPDEAAASEQGRQRGEEEEVSRTQSPEGLNHVSRVEQLPENMTRTPPEPVSGADEHDDKPVSSADDSQAESDLIAQCTSAQPVNPEEETNQGSDGHQDQPTDTCLDTETGNTQQNSLDPVSTQQNSLDLDTLKLNGQIAECSEPESGSRTLDLFYSDFDRSSSTEDLVGDPVEPMDLFYPDKEEPVFTEPPDTDMQRWPSVLSVSALQPAPASEDQEPDLQEDFRDREDLMEDQEHIKVIRQTNEESEDSPASQEQCALCGVTIGGPQGGDDAGGSSESERRDCGSSSRADEIQIPPVLRHRKGARLTESTDRQRAAPRKAHHDDFWFGENWELYLLLLLWLLLYSFWLLPQIDPKTLPSLLLNLDR